jgi:hypothetical protein
MEGGWGRRERMAVSGFGERIERIRQGAGVGLARYEGRWGNQQIQGIRREGNRLWRLWAVTVGRCVGGDCREKRGSISTWGKPPFDKLRANGQAFSFALSLSKGKFAPNLKYARETRHF